MASNVEQKTILPYNTYVKEKALKKLLQNKEFSPLDLV